MILIGQYDSPFVRRVAITASLYGMAFEHRPWSVFGDADKVAVYSPAKRVPILVLDDGEVVIDSAVILDALDQRAGGEIALTPAEGAARRAVLKVCALACNLADKAVALVQAGQGARSDRDSHQGAPHRNARRSGRAHSSTRPQLSSRRPASACDHAPNRP